MIRLRIARCDFRSHRKIRDIMDEFLIALGANLPFGDIPPQETLRMAIDRLSDDGIRVESVSRFYQTPCFPPGAGPDYVNAAASLSGDMAPEALLAKLHATEARFGRARDVRWGMRTLDLDLIAAGDRVLPDLDSFTKWCDLDPETQKRVAPDRLILPHPRLQDRAFVLVPLRDIAADWRHPVLHRTVTEMCDALPPEALAEIVALDS